MADKPTILPIWNTAETNVLEPDAAHKLDGWLAPGGVPEKPPYQNFNFWQNNVYKWAAYLEELSDSLLKVGRSQFAWVADDQISIAGGGYLHHGTKSQVLLIDSTITHTVSIPGTLQYQYIYLDDSAIVTKGTGIITNSEITSNLIAPTYSVTKKGWYNGNDLCIFALYMNASSDIFEFSHSGNKVQFWDSVNSWTNGAAASGTDYTVTLDIPAFARDTLINIKISGGSAGGNVWLNVGITGSQDIGVFAHANGALQTWTALSFIANDSLQITAMHDCGGTTNFLVDTLGWFFPVGM